MTAPRRDLAPVPRFARGLPIGRLRRETSRPGGLILGRAAREALVEQIEELVATHLATERGSVTGTERRAARLAAEIALGLDP